MVEQGTHKPLVGGSNPPSATTSCLPTTTTDAEIHLGARIVLADGNGNTLGVGALEEAQDSGTQHNVSEITGQENDLCVYTCQIEGVQTTDTCLLTVGPLPGPRHSLAQLDGVDWRPHCMTVESWRMR